MGDVPDKLVTAFTDDAHWVVHGDFVECVGGEDLVPARGLFFGGGFHQLFVQTIGVLAVFGWTVATSLILFYAIKKFIGLRVSAKEEKRGLDLGEHGSEAYNGFLANNL